MVTAKRAPARKAPASKRAGKKAAAGKTAAGSAPWDHENPKSATGEPTRHLTPAQKASAKRAAKKAGRPYPNLVDNMRAAQAAKKKAAS